MKRARSLCATALSIVLFVSPARTAEGTGPPATLPRPAATDLTSYVQAIKSAPDPSSVVAAYASGTAVNRTSTALNEAYIRRMTEFHLPQMAYQQALTLQMLDPGNGLAWAVMSFVSAQRGDMPIAFAHESLAVKQSPDDPFVQTVAGQLVAWYDYKPDRPEATPLIKDMVARLRAALADKETYKHSYADALAALKDQGATAAANSPSPQPAAGQVLVEPTNPPSTAVATINYYNDYYGSNSTPYSYYTAPVGCASPYYDTYAYGPSFFGSGFFFGCHHAFDHAHHGGGLFDRGRGRFDTRGEGVVTGNGQWAGGQSRTIASSWLGGEVRGRANSGGGTYALPRFVGETHTFVAPQAGSRTVFHAPVQTPRSAGFTAGSFSGGSGSLHVGSVSGSSFSGSSFSGGQLHARSTRR